MTFKAYEFNRNLTEVIIALESRQVLLESDEVQEQVLGTLKGVAAKATTGVGRAADAAISSVGSGVIAGAQRGARVAMGKGQDPRLMIGDAVKKLAAAFDAAGKMKDVELQKAMQPSMEKLRSIK